MRSSVETRSALDSIVVEIELTLTSIIQGVALTFLAENANAALSLHDWSGWLHVGARNYLIAATVVALTCYLAYVVRLYRRLLPMIFAMRADWYRDAT